MEVRKLRPEEHLRTRKLWEDIFKEDTPEFLDYYYTVKTKENEIYVIEDEGEIVSMLHLNPYTMRIGKEMYPTHYIVAVATRTEYRRQGLMAKLMNHVIQVMKDRGEPFTFLMPANEAYYKPFGFQFVYEQKQGKVFGKQSEQLDIDFSYAMPEDCKEIADYANQKLTVYDIVTWRNQGYYETILAEQQSENGGILLARKEGKIVGVFCFSKDDEVHMWEPLFEDKEVLEHAIYLLTGSQEIGAKCIGYGDEKLQPIIMAKILDDKMKNVFENVQVFLNEVV